MNYQITKSSSELLDNFRYIGQNKCLTEEERQEMIAHYKQMKAIPKDIFNTVKNFLGVGGANLLKKKRHGFRGEWISYFFSNGEALSDLRYAKTHNGSDLDFEIKEVEKWSKPPKKKKKNNKVFVPRLLEVRKYVDAYHKDVDVEVAKFIKQNTLTRFFDSKDKISQSHILKGKYITALIVACGRYRQAFKQIKNGGSSFDKTTNDNVRVASVYWANCYALTSNVKMTCDMGVIPSAIPKDMISQYSDNQIRLPILWIKNVLCDLGGYNYKTWKHQSKDHGRRGDGTNGLVYKNLLGLKYKGKKVFVLSAKPYPIKRLNDQNTFVFECEVVTSSNTYHNRRMHRVIDSHTVYIVKTKIDSGAVFLACHDQLRTAEQLVEQKVRKEVLDVLTDI